jgi:hypothetical protein
MKNLFRPLLVLTGCIVLASCVSQKQFKGLKTDYTKLQKEYQESQLQLQVLRRDLPKRSGIIVSYARACPICKAS